MKLVDLYTVQPEQFPSDIEPNCHHRQCGQYCTLTSNENPDSTPNLNRNSFHTVTRSSVFSIHTPTNTHINALDLPPSYVSSTKDLSYDGKDKYDLPPSYSEAVTNMSNPKGFPQQDAYNI